MRINLYLISGVFIFFFISGFNANAQRQLNTTIAHPEAIRLNQLGFYPESIKIVIIPAIAKNVSDFSVFSLDQHKVIYKGKLNNSISPALNGKHTKSADFSVLSIPGNYRIQIDGVGTSYTFPIRNTVYQQLGRATLKAFYYQRGSLALIEKYAGKWHRKAGHADDHVLIHASAATTERPAGTIIQAERGWYDAGDYNKYIVNSGVTMGTLLSLYEDFPGYMTTQTLNIPETGNGVPDILNEVIWNLRWMLKMQDPNDGGVYNKLTNADFDGMVMPDVARKPRYVVQKGTAATLDFAAVTAQASRILKVYNKQFPGLADSCLKAAVRAWKWASQHPEVKYDQNQMNQQYEPKITTGGYGDHDFTDERIWAALELYLSTEDESYYKAVDIFPDDAMPLPSWNNVRLLGYYSLIRKQNQLKGAALHILSELKIKLINLADAFVKDADKTAYLMPFGKNGHDFKWGSNSFAANQGIALIQAYRLSGDAKYFNAASANLDYLLGRNATGYSYVTGFGVKHPMHPHHRPSFADGITDPVPGFLVGGPNPGNQDGIALSSKVPDEAYIDDAASYASNEIAINWNAPFAYLVNAIEALEQLKNKDKKKVRSDLRN